VRKKKKKLGLAPWRASPTEDTFVRPEQETFKGKVQKKGVEERKEKE